MSKDKQITKMVKDLNKHATEKGFSAQIGMLDDFDLDFPRRATEYPNIDSIIGGGWPFGTTAVVAGQPGVGKTAFLLRMIGQMMQQDPDFYAFFGDGEHRFEKAWALKQGIDPKRLLYAQFETLEDGLKVMEKIIRDENNPASLLVYDSLDSTHPRGRFQSKRGKTRDIDDDDVALKARLMSDYYPRVMHPLRKLNKALIFVAQLRTKGIGSAFVTEDFSGGNAVKHYDTLELFMRLTGKKNWPTDSDGVILGHEALLKITKGSLSGVKPHAETTLTFFEGQGFITEYLYVKQAMEEGFITTSGSWAAWPGPNGEEEKLQSTKPAQLYQKMLEEDKYQDFLMVYTGEIDIDDSEEPDVEVATLE